MKTILVPIDFTEACENAANYAAELAKFTKARVIFLHTYSLTGPLAEIPVTAIRFDEIEKINDALLKSLDVKIKAVHGDIETELIATAGFPIEEIILVSEQKKVDMIVIGTTEQGKIPAILNSNTVSVIKGARCPVLTIPENVRFAKPRTIALACDYNSILPDEVVSSFKNYVKLFDAKVLVFDVLKKAELVTAEKAIAEENLNESLNDIDHSLYFPSGDNVVEEINSFVDGHKVDVLAMIPHKYNFISGLFHNSNTKLMALHTRVPLLTIHD
jgi:nucleotide-binding universal stress UspA family protein